MDGWLRVDIDAYAADEELDPWVPARRRVRQDAAAEVTRS